MFFTNLPLRYIESNPHYLDFFLTQELNPELGIDVYVLESLSRSWHQQTARSFHDAGLACAIHLPFFDLHPGSLDPWVREVCTRRLIQAMDVAKIYQPAHYVAHLDYNPLVYSRFEETWLKNSLNTWSQVLETADNIPIYLENVYEPSPHYQVMVLEGLGRAAKACFDIGHWHSFGKGRKKDNLENWLTVLDPHLGHLHLHDNDGSADQHLGIGQGAIQWNHFGELISALPHELSATLEPHTEQDFLATRTFLRMHPGIIPF